ncbi:uncharacterized protein B0H64DRAFT_430057 [Chaetomium fimeti]|uniref:Uncharacterized protein n=1 Tax=Chaetomium fimeti TaxID=1854472 RepID=A0AAE0HLX5_9PEZI|nr:hypothetical protein B0H64DRAFT_430057 [Chaetomium fimeti]
MSASGEPEWRRMTNDVREIDAAQHATWSTIPRGMWKNHMKSQGQTEAPNWHAAAYSQPLQGGFKEKYHSEDSVEYICNRQFGSFYSDRYEEPRMVVYGKRGAGGDVGKSNPCDDRRKKNPSCTDVADLLGIKILGRGYTALDLDQMDANEPPPPPAPSTHTTTWESETTEDQYYASPAYQDSWSAPSSSTQHYSRGHDNSSRTHASRRSDSSRGREDHQLSRLAGSMLGLSIAARPRAEHLFLVKAPEDRLLVIPPEGRMPAMPAIPEMPEMPEIQGERMLAEADLRDLKGLVILETDLKVVEGRGKDAKAERDAGHPVNVHRP